jgi:hypothetical protein
MKRTESRNHGWDDAHYNRATPALDEDIDAEPRHSRQSVGNVAGTLLAKRIDGLLIGADQIGRDAARVIRRKCAASGDFDRRKLSVNLDLGWTPRRKNQIADLLRCAQHAGQQHRCRDRVRSIDAIEGNRDRRIPRSSHSKHSQLSVLTPQRGNTLRSREPMS